MLTPVEDPGLAVMAGSDPLETTLPDSPEEDALYDATGMEEAFAQSFYCGFYKAVEEDRGRTLPT